MTGAGADDQPRDAPSLLLVPRDGLPPVVADPATLVEVVRRFAEGTGPVAVDAERASGYRYVPRAYLVQLRRRGSGTALIDPVALPDLSALGVALGETEWVLHAAGQDIPSLRAVGLVVPELFDTELAARLLGLPRVGLGPLLEDELGVRLEKGHSAADWSQRPLPEPWLGYAALDVELLLELRDRLEAQLDTAGKLGWAREEFAYVAGMPDPTPRAEPWRRTSGLHRVRDRRRLAIARELWQERDRIAQQRDLAPGRVLADRALVEVAVAAPRTTAELAAVPGMRGRGARRRSLQWLAAVRRALAVPEHDLPRSVEREAGTPPSSIRQWAERDPAAAARLRAARGVLVDLSERLSVPVENLAPPDAVRRLCWTPPTGLDTGPESAVADVLRRAGARPWQVGLVAAPIGAALARVSSS